MIKPFCKTCERIIWAHSTEFIDCLSEHDLTYVIVKPNGEIEQ